MQSSSASPVSPISPLIEGFTSTLPGGESSSRRQRISMACRYCRHRKIKCCGSAPCANCTRARRACDYSPVPEEVNRATREKKAAAKAAKQYSPTPYGGFYLEPPMTVALPAMPSMASMPNLAGAAAAHAQAQHTSPYFASPSVLQPHPHQHHTPQHSMSTLASPVPPAFRAQHMTHRRSFSTPNLALPPYSPAPPAPMMSSPAQLESSPYLWSSGPAVPSTATPHASPAPPSAAQFAFPAVVPQLDAYPSVFQPASTYLAPGYTTPSRGSSVESASSSSVPSLAPASGPSSGASSSAMPSLTVPFAQQLALQTPPQSPAFYQTPTFAYTPQPFPFSPSPLSQATFHASPTLAPDLAKQQLKQPQQQQQQQQLQPSLVGLGIGMHIPPTEEYYTPVLGQDEFMGGAWQ
ncbi:hypothetical protein Q5752_005939 [Cryptotrichosporon argae]